MTCTRCFLLLFCSAALVGLVLGDGTAGRPETSSSTDRAMQLLRLHDGTSTFTILVAANADLYNLPQGLRRVVVCIEDDVFSSESSLEASDGTLVLVPQFQVIDGRPMPMDLPAWHGEQAWTGGELSSEGAVGLSAFAVLDGLLGYLKRSSHFSELQEMVFVGHGMAAELVERHGMRPPTSASFRIRHMRAQVVRH
ncbi:hypothetical protein DNK10_23685 [Pseudomonas daroniae]|nr:hypothetical protein DNK10_23685 [Pseudomonas daroniae]